MSTASASFCQHVEIHNKFATIENIDSFNFKVVNNKKNIKKIISNKPIAILFQSAHPRAKLLIITDTS